MNRTQCKEDLGIDSMQDRHQKATYPDSCRDKFLRLSICLDLLHSFYTYRIYQQNLHHILDRPKKKYCLGSGLRGTTLKHKFWSRPRPWVFKDHSSRPTEPCLGYIYIQAHKCPLYILYSQSRLYLARMMRLRLNDLIAPAWVFYFTCSTKILLNLSIRRPIQSQKSDHDLTSAVFDSHVSTLTIRTTTPASIPSTTIVITISNRTYFPNDIVLRNFCFRMEKRLPSRVYER